VAGRPVTGEPPSGAGSVRPAEQGQPPRLPAWCTEAFAADEERGHVRRRNDCGSL